MRRAAIVVLSIAVLAVAVTGASIAFRYFRYLDRVEVVRTLECFDWGARLYDYEEASPSSLPPRRTHTVRGLDYTFVPVWSENVVIGHADPEWVRSQHIVYVVVGPHGGVGQGVMPFTAVPHFKTMSIRRAFKLDRPLNTVKVEGPWIFFWPFD